MSWFKVMAIAAVLLALGLGARNHSLAPIAGNIVAVQPERWERERAAAELAGEEKDARIPLTACPDFASGPAPKLCLERLSPAETPLGEPVQLRLRWRGLPAGGYTRLAVISAAPAGTRYRYAGPAGSITADPVMGPPDGERVVTWDGRGVYCAPADAPMMCHSGQVGRFTIRARMLTGTDPWWPSWPAQNPVAVEWLARSDAVEVDFTGLPRLPLYGNASEGEGVGDAIKRAIPADLDTMEQWDDTSGQWGAWRETPLSYCADLTMVPPLTGKVTACFPKSSRDRFGLAVRKGDVGATANVATMPGVVSRAVAEKLAQRAAAALLPGLDFDHNPSAAERAEFKQDRRITYRDQGQTIAHFRTEGRFWLVSVDQSANYVGGDRIGSLLEYTYGIDAGNACLLGIWDPSDPASRRINDGDPAALRCPARA